MGNSLLTQLPNIGKVLSERLKEIEIETPEKLKSCGTENTFIKLKTIDSGACLNELFAIEGAIQGIRWHNLTLARKEELKSFFLLQEKKN